MLTFSEFVQELSRPDISLSPSEVDQLRVRFGEKALQMGHLQRDGSLLVPVGCIVEAARELGGPPLAEAAESLKRGDSSPEPTPVFRSVEQLVERVAAARDRNLRRMVREYQAERNDEAAASRWKNIEREVFGVEFED